MKKRNSLIMGACVAAAGLVGGTYSLTRKPVMDLSVHVADKRPTDNPTVRTGDLFYMERADGVLEDTLPFKTTVEFLDETGERVASCDFLSHLVPSIYEGFTIQSLGNIRNLNVPGHIKYVDNLGTAVQNVLVMADFIYNLERNKEIRVDRVRVNVASDHIFDPNFSNNSEGFSREEFRGFLQPAFNDIKDSLSLPGEYPNGRVTHYEKILDYFSSD